MKNAHSCVAPAPARAAGPTPHRLPARGCSPPFPAFAFAAPPVPPPVPPLRLASALGLDCTESNSACSALESIAAGAAAAAAAPLTPPALAGGHRAPGGGAPGGSGGAPEGSGGGAPEGSGGGPGGSGGPPPPYRYPGWPDPRGCP